MLENNQKEIALLKDLGMIYPKENSKYKKRYGLYKCFCGNKFRADMSKIKNKYTQSCGCYKMQALLKSNTTHGLTGNKLYSVWSVMLNRCENKNNKDYENYGARGITVCDEWKTDFVSFYNWAIDKGYKEGLSIDRENNNLGYSPDNCRWTTKEIQARNTRQIMITKTSGYRGVGWHKRYNKWVAKISVNKKRIHLGYFSDKVEAAKAYDKYIIDNNLEHTRNFS